MIVIGVMVYSVIDVESIITNRLIVILQQLFKSFTSAVKRFYNRIVLHVKEDNLTMQSHRRCNRILTELLHTFSSNTTIKYFDLTIFSVGCKILLQNRNDLLFNERNTLILLLFCLNGIFNQFFTLTEQNTILTVKIGQTKCFDIGEIVLIEGNRSGVGHAVYVDYPHSIKGTLANQSAQCASC